MKSKINKTVTVLSTAIVILVAVLVVLDPKTTTLVANNIFNGILLNLDWAFLIGTLLALLFLVYLMISKYGKLRLGKEAPDFSMVKIYWTGEYQSGTGSAAYLYLYLRVDGASVKPDIKYFNYCGYLYYIYDFCEPWLKERCIQVKRYKCYHIYRNFIGTVFLRKSEIYAGVCDGFIWNHA